MQVPSSSSGPEELPASFPAISLRSALGAHQRCLIGSLQPPAIPPPTNTPPHPLAHTNHCQRAPLEQPQLVSAPPTAAKMASQTPAVVMDK